MSFENNSISVPFHWSGGVWAVTIVTLIVFAGAGFYIASLNWPTVMLWLKYLLTIVLLTTVIAGVSYTPIRLKAMIKNNGKQVTWFIGSIAERGNRDQTNFEV